MNYHSKPNNELGKTPLEPKDGDLVRIIDSEETPPPYRKLSENDQETIITYQANTGASNSEVARKLGVDDGVVARVKSYSSFKDVANLIKAVRVQAGEIANKSYALLNQKLDDQGDRMRPVELAGIATYASNIMGQLDKPEGASEPSWDDLEPLQGDPTETKGKVIG